MMNRLPTLTDEEVRRIPGADEEAGFGALTTEKGPLPLKALDVKTRIDGLVARTTVRQTFVNTHAEPLEATYIFPLPDRAAVTAFRMEVAGRIIEAALKERGEARRDYDQAMQEGRRASIAEEERPGVFTLRVGNLMPGEEAVLRLTLCGPLEYADGEATFRFPLVVAPRYIPGTPLTGPSVGEGVVPDTDAVPHASRISPPVLLPGFPDPVCLSLEVEVHGAGLPLSDFRSSLHAVVVEQDDKAWRIRVQPGERLDRDFILRFRVGEGAIRTALAFQPDAEGEEGTFLLTLVPPIDQTAKQKPRDVVFVLDRSGSMSGWKMVAARRAVGRMVDTLTDHDRFAVYTFDDRIETPPAFGDADLVQAIDRNRFRAVEFLAQACARGGTEMAHPLDKAVTTLTKGDKERDRILVLITDGQVGNEDQILRTLGERLRGMRVFTLGIDRAVNEAFLKRLALLGGGACEIVESEDRLDEVMANVHRRIGMPVLSGMRLEPAGLKFDPRTIVPSRLPDLFAGAPVLIQGRCARSVQGGIAVQATDAAGRMWSETFPLHRTADSALTPIWARGRVRDLEDSYAGGTGDRAALEKEIVETSLRFGVLCRFTAFVAVDVKEVVNPGGQVHRITQPVEPASGWAMLTRERLESTTMVTACFAMSPRLAAAGRGGAVPEARTDLHYLAEEMEENLGTPSYGAPVTNFGLAKAPTPKGSTAKPAGFIGRLRKVLRGKTPAPPAPPPADLSAYRRRAQELLRRLEAAPDSDRLTVLGVLAVQLAALIEDLKSVGAPKPEMRPLEKLLNQLRAVSGESAAAQLWAHAQEVLKAFAEGGAVAVARREGFWK
jgi:Ca-activated chloride channel homolog